MVFIDKKSRELFTLMKKEESTDYSDEEIRYPHKLGLTGEVSHTKDIFVTLSPKKEPAYNVDVDNTNNLELQNLMFGGAANVDGENLGIL